MVFVFKVFSEDSLIDFENDNPRLKLYNAIVEDTKLILEINKSLKVSSHPREQEVGKRRVRDLKNRIDANISRLYSVENIIDLIELPS
jgi:hypothetical protein